MAKKAIVNLQINDEAFKKFVAAFEKYKQALAATPGVWSDVGEHIEGIKENLFLTTTALIEQVEAAKALTEEASKKRKEVEDEESAWRKIAGHSKNFSSNVISATRSILRWTVVGGIVSGLFGVGSLFGLERLGSGAARTSYPCRVSTVPTNSAALRAAATGGCLSWDECGHCAQLRKRRLGRRQGALGRGSPRRLVLSRRRCH